ncbi:APEH [Bugula neritina]|uniref:acylaminoacyl-peptidase n=1 Tax=Bugula neritina TaxID=10212 RepID=A0A7J7KN20_BUGNE|nr:APEH [Bugula neritina]
MINWLRIEEASIVVDVVETGTSDDLFFGMYCESLPANCWNSTSTHVIFSTECNSVEHIFSVELQTGSITRLTDTPGCWLVRDIQGDQMLASVSCIDMSPALVVASLKNFQKGTSLSWKYLDPVTRIPGIKWQFKSHLPRIPHPVYSSLTYESIVLQPSNRTSKGLILFPHGGPHSVFTAGYMSFSLSMAKLGFTVALVNYRGSTGFGEASIRSLVGNIGDADVKDVHQCAEEILEEFGLDREKVAVFGESHGGFLAAHLIGQYPDFYKAAAIYDAVTNLVTMVPVTDIPDWVHSEANVTGYSPGKVPTAEVNAYLYSKSPVAYINNIKAPTMVLVSGKDKRVPLLKAQNSTRVCYIERSNQDTCTLRTFTIEKKCYKLEDKS